MPTRISIGYSRLNDPQQAGEEAVKQALVPLVVSLLTVDILETELSTGERHDGATGECG